MFLDPIFSPISISSANMVVVTDGAFAPPGLEACDNLLSQLRSKVISLSFLQVSGAYRPQNGLARMPYVEIMEYLAYSTYGSYLPVVSLFMRPWLTSWMPRP